MPIVRCKNERLHKQRLAERDRYQAFMDTKNERREFTFKKETV